jgi:hypothetical protein
MEHPAAPQPSPEIEDVYQEEPSPFSTVPVHIEGPVQVHELPARRAQMKTDVVSNSGWTPLLPETPKRKRLVMISTDKSFYLSIDGTGVSGFLWPANVALVLEHTQRVYAMSADPAGSTISHCSELWAD